MKPALEAFKSYLDAKQIKYELSQTDTLWFSLMIPTPETTEMPNRIISCSVTESAAGTRSLVFSAAVMTVELADDLLQQVTSFFMRFQSSELKYGRIHVQPEGSVFYHLTLFLCAGGTSDGYAVSAMIRTAILEIAALFMAKDEVVRQLPTATVPRFGLA